MNEVLKSKTLVMLVAPSAMGKSTIVDTAVELNDEFERVRSFTTRPPRLNDEPDQFFYFSPEELERKRSNDQIITEVVFPTTGQIYGTVAESFSGRYSVLETLSGSVDDYRNLPFERTYAISLTAPPELWQVRFSQRYPKVDDDAKKRLQEALLSIKWSLAQTQNHYWLINDGTPDEVAGRLIDMVRGKAASDDGAPYARAIMEAAAREV